jgi:hypothetical protein
LYLIWWSKSLNFSVRKFIHKESLFVGGIPKYNKYLCSAKVISFIA